MSVHYHHGFKIIIRQYHPHLTKNYNQIIYNSNLIQNLKDFDAFQTSRWENQVAYLLRLQIYQVHILPQLLTLALR